MGRHFTNFRFTQKSVSMYKTIIDNESFEIIDSQDGHVVNGVPFRLDILSISDNSFHILHGNKSYRAEVVKTDPATKSFTIKINGRLYVVDVKDKFDLLLEKMGMKNPSSGVRKSQGAISTPPRSH